ncbi:protein CASPARIAN STRIP INTEGRITY FACTOR 1-like [Triticum dicoccoides]|uniref:protein CASPARIAN STRIP INTEGRITY FACTOR 1-like n=1 Tax=Triticum dicoccoides TaxID=85692 RepID=UPI000E7A3953|nr:protein CASPARIAN STRIP INTEGRITY FACTOR 1-like [Triticum dicoccoides]
MENIEIPPSSLWSLLRGNGTKGGRGPCFTFTSSDAGSRLPCVTEGGRGERMHRVSNPEMGMPRRSASLFALAFFALLLSTSLAGRQRPSFIVDQESPGQQGEVHRDEAMAQLVHSRMLKDMTTSDYGTYDPTPSMQKPHFKLIPN